MSIKNIYFISGQSISDLKAIWIVFSGDLERSLREVQQSDSSILDSSTEISTTESFNSEDTGIMIWVTDTGRTFTCLIILFYLHSQKINMP